MGDEEPGNLCCGCPFEVSGEAAASSEPGKGALDDPAPGQQLEAFDTERPLDDLDLPRPAVRERLDELFAAIDPICKDVVQFGKALSQPLQQRHGAMDILHVGRMDVDSEQKAISVGDNMPLCARKCACLDRTRVARRLALSRRFDCRRSLLSGSAYVAVFAALAGLEL